MLAVEGVAEVTFGKKLRELADAVGLSERQLSVKAGLPFGTVHNYFLDRTSPTWINMIKLSEALGVECSVFKECNEDLQTSLKMKPKKGK